MAVATADFFLSPSPRLSLLKADIGRLAGCAPGISRWEMLKLFFFEGWGGGRGNGKRRYAVASTCLYSLWTEGKR